MLGHTKRDEVTELRLELYHVKLQRDAFQASLRKEVLDVMRYNVAEIQAQLTLGGNALAVSKDGQLVAYADYVRLKAEVERLRKAGNILFTACNPAHVGTTRRISARKSWVEANKEESK